MSGATLDDLDRCPHGRHAGDACAGWTGPGEYDGGCEGGVSLGNPHLRPGQLIGYDISRRPIHVGELRPYRATPAHGNWKPQ
jgi:hypothetical protein